MSNVEKAADIIAKANSAYRERHWLSDIVTYQAALEYAHALADAGLLGPDLPEPTSHGWPVNTSLVRKITLGVGGKVALLPDDIAFQEAHITPQEARALAYALLAAANHAEGKA